MAIGKLFHIIHMTGELDALEKWYDDVFSVQVMMPHSYMEGERRDASLVLLGDSVIEPLAPAFSVPDWADYPLGRFYNRFGAHWHSIAWYTDDAGEIWENAQKNNIRVFVEGGVLTTERPKPTSAIMTHPKDTITQLEFMNPEGSPLSDWDPRINPAKDWDPDWWIKNHPVKTPGLAYTTILSADLDRSTHVYADILGGTLLHKGTSELTGTEDVYIQLGDTVVQLSKPVTEGTIAAEDFAKNKEIHHAAAFKVLNLDDTEAYFKEKGIATVANDGQTLITDPATTFGVPFRWTTWDVPGGPRDTK